MSYLNPGRKGLIGAPTYPMLRDATQTALLRILEANEIPYTLLKSENTLLMRDTGSQLLLRSLEEYERLRGTNLAWFGVDELTYAHREAWLRLEGRLRDPGASSLCGFAVWTPKGHDWVYKRFLLDPPDGYETVVAKPMENKHILEKVPDFYDRLKKSYDEKFFRQEVLGEYLNIEQGRVYHAFDRDVNLQEVELDSELPLLWAFDFNVDPMCCVVAQQDGDMFHVLDEIVLRRSSTAEACQEFLSRYPNHAMGVRVYGDAAGNSKSTKSPDTDYEIIFRILRESGHQGALKRVPKANPPVRDRIGTLNAQLRSADGEERLLIHPRCTELIRDFEELVYRADSSSPDKDKDKDRSHLSDAVGYMIWRELDGRRAIPKPMNRPLV